jgi:large subunit ribosomal protein L22
VKIKGSKLASAMEAKGVSADQLAQAIADLMPGGSRREEAARSALNNWLDGRDHPRCNAPIIRRLAGALGVRPVDIAKFTCLVHNHKGSPRKARLLVDLIRGKSVVEAQNLLTFTTKRAAANIKRALNSAATDAEQAEGSYDKLYVSECAVDQAVIMKRFQPKDRGRAHPILKPFSHITLSVEERTGSGKAGSGKAGSGKSGSGKAKR